ncbi:kinase, PfkB family [Marvinbryantia formatexigens DSM 14469]|uniref:Kinase, PfkB family n=1 Tax=Marvinbryantia formatexigens DSM 14469 TaxID=478749 RepID=C6LCI1_9FIRM|nr:carbohydrate kinase family protein [Marvinbryantia formatexigens]EET61645.1 kinase, PfkB family [Marvinbryantia formatexigens DSM 14469]UWO24534.1 carbohydrate kinase family protein [Marvinbryantia formatexigens DSM 14469]
MRKKMIAAGHICIDVTPAFECEKQNRLEDILAPGKLVNVGQAQFHPGGTVSNTGLAMKFLGADVFLMGKTGDDAFGTMLIQKLKERDAADGMIVSSGQNTSYSVVLAVPGIDRLFLHHPGANDTFTADDIDYDKCREAVLFHFGYPPVMAQMYRQEGSELVKMFARVKECGCLTSLDMAAMDEASEAAQADWIKIFKNTLLYVDFFLPSIEELMFAVDRERYYRLLKKADGRDMTEVISVKEDVAPLAQLLLDMGCKIVLIKCGAPGFYYKTAGSSAFEQMEKQSGIDFSGFSGKEGFEKSYMPDAVISGTGAGDTTIAAFLTAMVQGYPFEKCLQLASATGACCVAAADALGGLKTFEELENKINAGWKKNGEQDMQGD